jgi:hypothetical protein
MTQPASRKGPVLGGSPERYGNSRQGVAELLGNVQDSARGTAEWIDGLATSGGEAPTFSHDHRGGVWGRPLGVGHSMPMQKAGLTLAGQQLYETVFFLNVPAVASPSGSPVEVPEENGGYQYTTPRIYSNAPAGVYSVWFWVSTWQGQQWTAEEITRISLTSPGGGPSWVALNEGLSLPPGLVRVRVSSKEFVDGWQWSALSVSH